MNVLSLFNGMSFTAMALEELDVKVDNYYSSEIDKHANQATQALYPNTIHLGDIKNHNEWDLPEIDLLVAGFPCQAWSVAGKMKGDNDPRGALVHDLIAIWKKVKPKYFLFENVKMKKEFMEYINGLFGVEPILINSALVSAQNRKRYYWTNLPVSQPEDEGILLKHIIERDISNIELKNKTPIRLEKHSSVVDLECVGGLIGTKKWTDDGKLLQRNFSQRERIYSVNGKCPTLNAQSGGTAGVGSVLIEKAVPKLLNGASMIGRRINNGKRDDYNTDIESKQYIEINKDPTKSRNLSTVMKDTLLADKESGRHLPEDLTYRKLTVRECARLQTVPEDKIDTLLSVGISNTQLYKMLGNGFTMKIISHILKGME